MVVKTFQNRQANPNNPASSSDFNANGDELDVDLDAIITDLNNALLKTGGTMAGALSMGFFQINDLATPTLPGDAATKNYVDSVVIGDIDWQESVLDKDLTAPPGSPSTGDRYIVAAVATGAWTGHEEKITEYNGATWDFTTPNEGFACWVEDEDILYIYNAAYPSGSWVKFGSTVTHANLLGLAADDHTQYLLATGARKSTGNQEIEKADAALILDATSGTPRLNFDIAGVSKGALTQAGTAYEFYNLARSTPTIQIDADTGDITKVGDISMNSNALNSAGGLVELDGSSDVPLAQIPDILTGKKTDGNAVIATGSYSGNGAANRAIPHGLGVIPKSVFLWRSIGRYIVITPTGTDIIEAHQAATSGTVTVWDTTNFHVGDPVNGYGNEVGSTFTWTVIG